VPALNRLSIFTIAALVATFIGASPLGATGSAQADVAAAIAASSAGSSTAAAALPVAQVVDASASSTVDLTVSAVAFKSFPPMPTRAVHAAPAPVAAPSPVHSSAPVQSSAPEQQTASAGATPTTYGCGPALAYLAAHAAPGFTFQCPGNSWGHQAMTCVNHAPQCGGQKLIAIAVPCAAAYMNEAHNSWVLTGQAAGIDPYGYCH
jgi:hypothetical protein